MKDRHTPFFVFRYLVTLNNSTTSLFHDLQRTKEELMCEIIDNLVVNTKTKWKLGDNEYIFYGWQSDEEIKILKFARVKNEKIYQEGDTDIEVNEIQETKFVFLFIDLKHQIIFLERNGSVFSSVDNAINTFSEYLREKVKGYGYAVSTYPLVSKRKFWQYIEEADKIYELSLELNAPNLAFLGGNKTRDVLEEIKEVTNNEKFDMSIKNSEGKLKIAKEALGDWIDYVREVGGKYMLSYETEGEKITKNSKTDTKKLTILKKKVDKYTQKELREIRLKFESINRLETRDDYDEEE